MVTLVVLLGMVISTSALLESLWISSKNNCTSNEFACRNGNCVLHSSRCNDHNDCGDGSDEEACELVLCKDPVYFRCKNNRCISKSFVCDGEDDCADFSDEEECSGKVSKPTTCVEGQWQCSDKKLCIPTDYNLCEDPLNFRCKNMVCVSNSSLCNGEDDCGDSSDELDCSTTSPETPTCQKGEWQCADKNSCIPIEKVCNGESDCPDQSDEVTGCSTKIECDGFICNNGGCIPNEWLCDGQNDCTDKSDEQNCTDKTMADTPRETTKNNLDRKEVEYQETLDKLLSICAKRGDLELKQANELHSIRMQIEEENLKAARISVKVAELQIQIEETKLETAKLDS